MIADLHTLHALWSLRGIRSFLWDGKTIPVEQTRDILQRNERLFAESRHGLWGAWDRERNVLVGIAGLWFFRDPPALELIFAVRDEECGRGYATEAAAAVLEYAAEQLGMDRVEASTEAPNVASRRVLEKLGFRMVRRGSVEGRPRLFYDIQLAPGDAVELPTFAELTATSKAACAMCGSDAVRSDSPASRWTLLTGGSMSALMLIRGEVDAAVMLVITTVTLAAEVRARFQFRRCDRCGHEWRG